MKITFHDTNHPDLKVFETGVVNVMDNNGAWYILRNKPDGSIELIKEKH
jgi:hypothetical protein